MRPTALDRLGTYGELRFSCTGRGFLSTNSSDHPCIFTLGQLTDGDLLIACESADERLLPHFPEARRIWGVADDGAQVETKGRPVFILGRFGLPGVVGIWRVRAVTLAQEATVEPVIWRYFLTNLLPEVGPVKLSFSKFRLHPIQGFHKIAKALKRRRGVAVTYYLDIEEDQPDDDLASDLCSVLSIAMGTTITWVERAGFSRARDKVEALYESRVTRPWCPLAITGIPESGMLERWLEYYRSMAEEHDLREGVIKTYLDTKVGGPYSYIEARSASLCVCLEMLCSSVARLEGDSVLPNDQFEGLLPDLLDIVKTGLADAGVAEDAVERIVTTAKLKGLNRRSFGALLGRLLRKLDLTVAWSEQQKVVAYRNALIHEGRCYCRVATDEERARVPACADEIDEFFFLLEFVDQIMLAMLDPSLRPIPFREQEP